MLWFDNMVLFRSIDNPSDLNQSIFHNHDKLLPLPLTSCKPNSILIISELFDKSDSHNRFLNIAFGRN